MIIILKQDDIGINHATRKRNCRDQDVSREDLGGVGEKPEPGWVGVTIYCVMTRIMVMLHIKISLMTILTIMNKNDDEDFKGGYRET